MISIVGWYENDYNIGDQSFIQAFKKYLPDHSLTFSNTVKKKSDCIIFGGGGDPMNRVWKSYSKKRISKKTPLYALGVDIPLSGPNWQRLKQFNFRKIYCRSSEYTKISKQQGYDSVFYCPDIAFGLDYSKSQTSCGGVNIRSDRKKVGVILMTNVSPHYFIREHIKSEMLKALKELAKSYDLFFIPMCHSFQENDHEANKQLAVQIPEISQENIITYQHPTTILKAIGEMDVLITMRFHGAIFATITGTPFVSIAYPGKHSLFCSQENLEFSWIEAPYFNANECVEKVNCLMVDDGYRKKLENITKTNRNHVKSIFEEVEREWI